LGDSVLALLEVLLLLVSLYVRLSRRSGLLESWVLSNVGVNFTPHFFEVFRSFASFNVLGESCLVFVWVALLKEFHVFSNVSTIDVLFQGWWGEFSFGLFVNWESFWLVWDVKTSINGTFEGSEETRSSGGSDETNIEEDFEWSSVWSFRLLDSEISTISFDDSDVLFVQSDFFEGKETTSEQKSSGIGSWVVFEPTFGTFRVDVGSIVGQFTRIGSAQDFIMINGGIRNLASNFGVGESNNESVLG
jgi:hypothetical protein